jgi:EAL domain-containing protein (putative c-di-GMP-specific phosphodiesterase class I)
MLRETTKEISINLSTLDIEDAELRNKIISLVTANTDISSRIVFELLEDEEVTDFRIVKDFISLVKMFGVQIAIDDFGAGHSNFERLLSFQPDILKLDGSLIKDIHTNKYSRNVVETIKLFADKENIKTVAEFVHCKEVFDVVKEIGIDYMQGFYLGEPELELAHDILNKEDYS